MVAFNYRAVPGAFGEIFRQAFSLEAAAGGGEVMLSPAR